MLWPIAPPPPTPLDNLMNNHSLSHSLTHTFPLYIHSFTQLGSLVHWTSPPNDCTLSVVWSPSSAPKNPTPMNRCPHSFVLSRSPPLRSSPSSFATSPPACSSSHSFVVVFCWFAILSRCSLVVWCLARVLHAVRGGVRMPRPPYPLSSLFHRQKTNPPRQQKETGH